MTLTFTGPHKTVINTRMMTGFHSFDRSFREANGQAGFPLPSQIEVSGPQGVGKTNFVFTIGGIVARELGGDISWIELEAQNRNTIRAILDNVGFTGEVDCIFDKRDELMTEKLLDNILTDKWKDTQYSVGILDSIAAFSSTAEQQGEIGSANMGKRAMPMAQYFRRAERLMQQRQTPYCLMATNHQYPKIGGMNKFETTTPGGTAKNFMAHTLIKLKKSFTYAYPDGWLLQGKVVKNRDGFSGLTFQVFMVAGEGLHLGLSAMFDHVAVGLSGIDKKVLVYKDKKLGHLKDIVAERATFDFQPFIDDLMNSKLDTVSKIEDEENTSDDEE